MDSIYAECIGGLTDCYKALSVVNPECSLGQIIEDLIKKAQVEHCLSGQLMKEILIYHASRGNIQQCIQCIQENQQLLFDSIDYFDYCLSILISVHSRNSGLLDEVFKSKEGDIISTLFQKAVNVFKKEKEKEKVLKIYIRYLKFIIAEKKNSNLIHSTFKVF